VGAETDGGGGEPPAAARVVKLSATAMSRGSYVAVLLEERYTVTMLLAELPEIERKDRVLAVSCNHVQVCVHCTNSL